MGRTPWSPPSIKQDTMGVGFDLNCPDRSWCGAHVGPHKTKRRHRSGRLPSHGAHKRTPEGKEPREEVFKKRTTGTEPRKRIWLRSSWRTHRSRARLRSAAATLRAAKP